MENSIIDMMGMYAKERGIVLNSPETPASLEPLRLIAEEHLKQKYTSVTPTYYIFSQYREQEPQKSHLFVSAETIVKISETGDIIQEYFLNRIKNGIKYDLVALDSNNNIIEYYVPDTDKYTKYDVNTDENLSIVHVGNWDTVPLDKQQLLQSFDKKDRVFSWSDKTTGFVLHYRE